MPNVDFEGKDVSNILNSSYSIQLIIKVLLLGCVLWLHNLLLATTVAGNEAPTCFSKVKSLLSSPPFFFSRRMGTLRGKSELRGEGEGEGKGGEGGEEGRPGQGEGRAGQGEEGGVREGGRSGGGYSTLSAEARLCLIPLQDLHVHVKSAALPYHTWAWGRYGE